MGIINRTNDLSEQKESWKAQVENLVVNQEDIIVGIAERPVTITDCKVAMLGVSGSPTIALKALRFIAGTGGSSFFIGTTFAVTTYATSGYLSFSLPAAGSTTLNLQKGDVLLAVQGGGSGAATTATLIDVIVQNIQDIKTWY